ncbi:MAG: virulence protein SciE type [Candidatus Solibacter sp.]|jgi:type VI secretion system protein ImpE|nr:virulence protein SciE type [Candidatus Solibacter sp.]
MQQAEELYREGKLTEAIGSLQSFLRDHPSDKRARNFLFELLCFAGEYERARKQLAVLADESQGSRFGIAFYLAALSGEVERQAYYEEPAADGQASPASPPSSTSNSIAGSWNGKPFHGIRDMDARLGESLEFLAAGKYHRLPFRYLKRLQIEPPVKVRDLFWLPATIETTADLGAMEYPSILIPVLYPHTYLLDDDQTRLGRATEWAAGEDGREMPCGQRILLFGEEEAPLLSIRTIEFDAQDPSGDA